MDRQHIIDEIRRTARSGKPLGAQAFVTETGIPLHSWRGKLWARWGDAVTEAGFPPNEWRKSLGEAYILENLAKLTKRLQKYPTYPEIALEKQVNSAFPSDKTIQELGNKHDLIRKLTAFCEADNRYEDILPILKQVPISASRKPLIAQAEDRSQLGYVYLMSSAKKYKIGYSKAALSRTSVISNMSPDGGEIIHLIRTDDMRGIEAYWHTRFAEKRGNGEWFSLSASDIAAFKRRKFM